MYFGGARVPYARLKYDAGSRSEDDFEVEVKTILWLAGILLLCYLNDIADSALHLFTPEMETGHLDLGEPRPSSSFCAQFRGR